MSGVPQGATSDDAAGFRDAARAAHYGMHPVAQHLRKPGAWQWSACLAAGGTPERHVHVRGDGKGLRGRCGMHDMPGRVCSRCTHGAVGVPLPISSGLHSRLVCEPPRSVPGSPA